MTYFCDVEKRIPKELVPGVSIRTFWGERMLVSIVDFEPNAEVPPHTHPHEQAGTVISGRIEMTIGGIPRVCGPGESYVIPGGVEHGARAGDASARVMDVFSPVREEYQY